MSPLVPRSLGHLSLRCHPSVVSLARDHVAKLLTEWGRPDLVDDAHLVTTELVTNAMKAASGFYDISPLLSPDEAPTRLSTVLATCGDIIETTLYRTPTRVVLTVWDPVRTPPTPKQASLTDLTGRGLTLIAEVTHEWGYHRPNSGGKIVWAAWT